VVLSDSFDYVQGVQEGRFSLDTLNSLTKYPSIQTYHELGKRGILTETVTYFVGEVEVTEKVDGTNARVIVFPDGLVILGSREELLWATGDLIHNPALGIVNTLQGLGIPVAARAQLSAPDKIRVVYGEVYGDGIGSAGKRYAAGQKGLTGFRVFDVANVPVEGLVWSKEEAAGWRDRGGQTYETAEAIQGTADYLGAGRVPSISWTTDQEMPKTIEDTHAWLKLQAPWTRVALASQEGELAPAEGVVVRGFDVSRCRLLAKIRFEDYDRTMRDRTNPQRALRTIKPLKRSSPKGDA
jgi:hypothetical protein